MALLIWGVENRTTVVATGGTVDLSFFVSDHDPRDLTYPQNTLYPSDSTYPGGLLMSEVKEVYAYLNGQKVTATYDSSTDTYSIVTSAPSDSSWGQPNNVYPITLHAEDAAGNTTELGADDATYGSQLSLRVLEKTRPEARIISPAQDAVLGASNQEIVLEIEDQGGSELNLSSVVATLNGRSIAEDLDWTQQSAGVMRATYQAIGLDDGSNEITLRVSDNDGNISDTDTRSFVVSTAAPTLTVNTPVNNLLTNVASVTVSGETAPGSEHVTVSDVTINGSSVTVSSDGTFSTTVSLEEGSNSLVIVSRDSLGKTTSITRTVTLDTMAPIISDVVAEATTVDAGGTVRITFKVTD